MSIAPKDAKPDETFEIYVKAYLAWGQLGLKMKKDKKKLAEFARGYDIAPRMGKKPEDYEDANSLWESLDIHLRTVYSWLAPTIDELRPYMRSGFSGQGYIPLPAPSVKVQPEPEKPSEPEPEKPKRTRPVRERKAKKVAL